MLMPAMLPFLQGGRALRRQRTALLHALRAEPAVRLLPELLNLPLGLAPLPDPDAILAEPMSLALVAPPGGGRTLALLQVADRAARGNGAPALYLSLLDDDAANLTPRAIVAGAIHRAGLPQSLMDAGRPCVLLVDDYEALPANRRALWRIYLAGMAQSWPAARALVALPPGDAWPELRSLRPLAPDEATLASWLGRLLSDQEPQPILAALAREPLAVLRGSLCDLLLLALIYPMSGLPASRAVLYEQAYALVRPLLEAEAVEQANQPIALVGRAVLRHYRLARSLAGGADLATLADLPPYERATVAPLAAGLLDDPRPVLDLLWGEGDPDLPALRGLVLCARERPTVLPSYGLRLLTALSGPATPPAARALVAELAPALPALLGACQPDLAEVALRDLAATGELPSAMLMALIDGPTFPDALRWVAADLLATPPGQVRAGLAADLPAGGQSLDPTALAARCYVLALGRPQDRARLLEPELRAGLLAVLGAEGGEQRRRAATAAILADHTTPPELRTLALAGAPALAEDRALLEQAVADPATDVRQAALIALSAAAPEAALETIAAIIARDHLDEEALRDALDSAAGLPQTQATALIGRAVLADRLPVDARLYALDLLARRGREGAAVLLRLISVPRLAAALRAAAARRLGFMGVVAAVPTLRSLLLGDEEPLLRRAAAEALGILSLLPAARPAALASLAAALERPALDAGTVCRAAEALGASGATVATPLLGRLLAPGLAGALSAAWLRAAPALATTPALAWPTLDLPTHVRAALLDALATGETPADQPGSLEELTGSQAATIAMGAASALTNLATRRPVLAVEVSALLRQALVPGRPFALLDHLLACLAAISGDVAGLLDEILSDQSIDPTLRWIALDQLGALPASAEALLHRIQAGERDSFALAKIATLLGEHGVIEAMPALRQLAEGRDTDSHLRRAAIDALGRLHDSAATSALLRIATDLYAPTEARAAAAAALPADLDPASCRMLREQLRAERPDTELAGALLGALGRAGDREALSSMLRYAQSDRPLEAVAALDALTAIGEASVAPTLVRVAQNSHVSPGVRLAAVSALLRLWGDEYLPLLRAYLDASYLPLRLRAHESLAGLNPGDRRLVAPLADAAAPLALRIQALERLALHAPDDELLPMLLANFDEEPQLRLAAAAALARAGSPETVERLVATALVAAPLLARRCLRSLSEIARGKTLAAPGARRRLAALSIDAAAPPEVRHWAAELPRAGG